MLANAGNVRLPVVVQPAPATNEQANDPVDQANDPVVNALNAPVGNDGAANAQNEAQPQQQPVQLTADDLALAFSRATQLGAEYGVVAPATFRRFLPDNQQW